MHDIKVEGLRLLMKKWGLDAYLVPSADEHQNEFVPPCRQRRAWLSGFTGSAGEVVVTHNIAALWTDGRYHLQAEQELDKSVFTLFPVGLPDVMDRDEWLAETLPEGSIVGVDPKLITIEQARNLDKKLDPKGIGIRIVEENLVDLLWAHRPPVPEAPVFFLPETYSGESAASKLTRLREALAKENVDAHVIGALDSICWLFNLRGGDVPYNPVFIAYALVTSKKASIFTDLKRIPDDVRKELDGIVEFEPYEAFDGALDGLAESGANVLLDDKATSQWVCEKVADGGMPKIKRSPVVLFKAVKNPVEQEGMRRCHVRDGAAMVRFLMRVEQEVSKGGMTELSAAELVDSIRAETDLHRGPSFETIVGYADHSAIIHYSPSEATDKKLAPESLLLVDSGGQYLDGTTDVTRTIALGPPTREQIEHFTRVLKGHIQLATAVFPKGASGKQLDVLARKPLWDIGLNFLHGTGHGVGAFLNVHEGPQSISPRDTGVALAPGMVISNEPGFYRANAYGIRIENLVLVVENESVGTEYGPYYGFETLTLVPIDRRLIDPEMLSEQEIEWLDAYHARVFEQISPLLENDEVEWLKKATTPIRRH